MADTPEKPPSPRNADHLANERTFLAWIRTSISVIGLGFVVARFGVWLRELAARLNEPVRARQTGLSLPLGVGMMAVGGLLALMAMWRYRRVHHAIETNASAADAGSVVLVTVFTLAIAAALAVYMIMGR